MNITIGSNEYDIDNIFVDVLTIQVSRMGLLGYGYHKRGFVIWHGLPPLIDTRY